MHEKTCRVLQYTVLGSTSCLTFNQQTQPLVLLRGCLREMFLLLQDVFPQVTFYSYSPPLSVKHNQTEALFCFCLPSITWHTLQTHLTLPLCHVCGESRTPRSNPTKMLWLLCGHSRSNGTSTSPVHPPLTGIHTHTLSSLHTQVHTPLRHGSTISVTDLRLVLLCH